MLPQQITLTIKGETDAAPLPLGAMRYFGRFAGLTNDAGGEWLELSGFTFGFDPVIQRCLTARRWCHAFFRGPCCWSWARTALRRS